MARRRVLVIEVDQAMTADDAQMIKDRVTAELGEQYLVLVVTPRIRVYEVGAWLWSRVLRRRAA